MRLGQSFVCTYCMCAMYYEIHYNQVGACQKHDTTSMCQSQWNFTIVIGSAICGRVGQSLIKMQISANLNNKKYSKFY